LGNGREDPVVWFPAVQQNDAYTKQRTFEAATPFQKFMPRPVQHTRDISAKQTQLKKTMEIAHQRYLQGCTEQDLRKVTEQLKHIDE